MVREAFDNGGGGGSTDDGKKELYVTSTGEGSSYVIEVSGTIETWPEGPHSGSDPSDKASGSVARGAVAPRSYHFNAGDTFKFTGDLVHVYADNPSSFRVEVDGREVSLGGKKTRLSEDELDSTYQRKAGGGGGDLFSMIPGLLPAVGPLTSSQTTALAILVGLAVVGAVVG